MAARHRRARRADGARPRRQRRPLLPRGRRAPARPWPSRSTATTSSSTTSTASSGPRARRGSSRSCMDLSDPSPGLGWRARERPSFVDRVRPDLVLCLAVIHHLALSGTVPFPEIVAFLHDFSAPLVVEMPHRDDPMAARLLARKRAGRVRPLRPPAVGGGAAGALRRATSRSRCPRARARSTAAALADARRLSRRGGRPATRAGSTSLIEPVSTTSARSSIAVGEPFTITTGRPCATASGTTSAAG